MRGFLRVQKDKDVNGIEKWEGDWVKDYWVEILKGTYSFDCNRSCLDK